MRLNAQMAYRVDREKRVRRRWAAVSSERVSDTVLVPLETLRTETGVAPVHDGLVYIVAQLATQQGHHHT